MSTQHQFCFDISMDEKLDFFVPNAYIIANCDKIIYVDKKATSIIIKSFGYKYLLFSKWVGCKILIFRHRHLSGEFVLKQFRDQG